MLRPLMECPFNYCPFHSSNTLSLYTFQLPRYFLYIKVCLHFPPSFNHYSLDNHVFHPFDIQQNPPCYRTVLEHHLNSPGYFGSFISQFILSVFQQSDINNNAFYFRIYIHTQFGYNSHSLEKPLVHINHSSALTYVPFPFSPFAPLSQLKLIFNHPAKILNSN